MIRMVINFSTLFYNNILIRRRKIKMKIVFIIACVLLLAGMLALDMFISRDINSKKDDNKDEK